MRDINDVRRDLARAYNSVFGACNRAVPVDSAEFARLASACAGLEDEICKLRAQGYGLMVPPPPEAPETAVRSPLAHDEPGDAA